MEKNIVSPEELAAEQVALQESKEDEVRANIINEFGFDESVDADKIDRLVTKEMEFSKKLSSAIGQKIKVRNERDALLKNTPPPLDKTNNLNPEKKPDKSGELGYAEKAFLQGNDIKGEKEFAIVKDYLASSSLDEIVDDTSIVGEIVRSKIKKLREAETTQNAVPKGTKHSSGSPKDSVDYWLKKPFNEVPQEMRIAVNNKRIEQEKNKNIFVSNSNL